MKKPSEISPFNISAKIDSLINEIVSVNTNIESILKRQDQLGLELGTQITNTGILQISNNEVIRKLFNGLKIYLDISDMSVATHIALDGIWEPSITKAWQNIIKPEYTILDIGANFGYFGLIAAHLTDKKKARIVMFEANSSIIPFLNNTFSLNWYNEQCTIENLAVSDKDGVVKLNVLENYTGSSSLQTLNELGGYMDNKMKLKVKQVQEVKSVRIDSYCKTNNIKQVDLIKMDIEGHEEAAYEGMRTIVKASPNLTLFIEFTKASYNKPKVFYNTMLKDFGNVYTINQDGKLVKEADCSYEKIIGECEDWVMPVFSKRSDLDK